jgi:hypothetical protein
MATPEPLSPREVVPGEDPLRRPPGARPTDAPDGSALDAHLLDLRARLRQARAERGGCPSWEELRADLVPGGGSRPGRAERQAHVALCHYCSTHVEEWRKSEDFAADRLDAIERGVVRGIAGGALGLLSSIGRALPARNAAPRRERPTRPEKRALSAREEREVAEAAARGEAAAAPPPVPMRVAPTPAVGPGPSGVPGRAERAAEPAAHIGRILVVEMAGGRAAPESVYLCAQVLEAEVAEVDSVDELVGDPDLAQVCGIVLGGLRPPGSWPDAVRHARGIAPGRPVVLLAGFGAEPDAAARRALGDALLSEADPAEHLLLALDPGLR